MSHVHHCSACSYLPFRRNGYAWMGRNSTSSLLCSLQAKKNWSNSFIGRCSPPLLRPITLRSASCSTHLLLRSCRPSSLTSRSPSSLLSSSATAASRCRCPTALRLCAPTMSAISLARACTGAATATATYHRHGERHDEDDDDDVLTSMITMERTANSRISRITTWSFTAQGDHRE